MEFILYNKHHPICLLSIDEYGYISRILEIYNSAYAPVGVYLTNINSLYEWWKGRQILIDKVTDCRPAASLKHGGQGLRFTCRIHNKTVYLFMDEGHWFIEQI